MPWSCLLVLRTPTHYSRAGDSRFFQHYAVEVGEQIDDVVAAIREAHRVIVEPTRTTNNAGYRQRRIRLGDMTKCTYLELDHVDRFGAISNFQDVTLPVTALDKKILVTLAVKRV